MSVQSSHLQALAGGGLGCGGSGGSRQTVSMGEAEAWVDPARMSW